MMSLINCELRRATLDDLAGLRRLWTQAALPADALEKRLTEFQVAEAIDGTLLACVGLQLEGRHGRIHSGVYRSPELQTELQERLWERVQTVARNHGLWKLWTQDHDTFRSACGFQEADEAVLEKLPPKFGRAKGIWLVLTLREEVAPAVSFEHEFGLFGQSQKELTDRALRQARVFRVVAAVITFLFVVFALWMMWRVFRNLPNLTKP